MLEILALTTFMTAQTAPPHWDIEDRRVVSSVISPCLSAILGGAPITTTGWTGDPGMNWYGRPRSDNTEYRATFRLDLNRATPSGRCTVTVPSGDLAGAIAQLDAVKLDGYTPRREGNEWTFYDGGGEAFFTLGAVANPTGSVSVWAGPPVY